MKRKHSILIKIFPLLILVFSGSLLIAFPRYKEWQDRMQEEIERNRLEAMKIIEGFEDTLFRHPDLDLSRFRAFLAILKKLKPEAQAMKLKELKERYTELERDASEQILGHPPGPNSDSETEMFKTFSPNGFKNFYESLESPKTRAIDQPPHITVNGEADRRIIRLAEERGYTLRFETDPESLVWVEGRRLQPEAAEAWKKLEAEAGREGIRLGIISAHRPVDYQRRIFLNLLKIGALEEIGRPYTDGEIAGGMADGLIDRVLRESSIPGYSKHHSGYTIDITDLSSGRDFTEFGHTSGFQWISAKNYLKAKKYGFIPSYPQGAAVQGPDPEPWEYVWVGTEALVKPALITH